LVRPKVLWKRASGSEGTREEYWAWSGEISPPTVEMLPALAAPRIWGTRGVPSGMAGGGVPRHSSRTWLASRFTDSTLASTPATRTVCPTRRPRASLSVRVEVVGS